MDESDQDRQPQSVNSDLQVTVKNPNEHPQPLLKGIDYHNSRMRVPMLKSLTWDLGLSNPQKSRESFLKLLDCVGRYPLGAFADCRKIPFQGIGHDPSLLERFKVASMSQSLDEDGKKMTIHLLDGLTAVIRPVQQKGAPKGGRMLVTGLPQTLTGVTGIPTLREGRPAITQGFLGRRSSTHDEKDEVTVICLRLGQRPRTVSIISFRFDHQSATQDVFLETLPKAASIKLTPSVGMITDVKLPIHKPPSGAIDEQEVSGETTEMAGVTIPASFDDNDKVADTEGAVDTFENYTNFYSIMDAMGIPTNTDEVPDIVDTSTTTLSESENYYNSQETLLGDSYPFPSSTQSWTEEEWVVFDQMMEHHQGALIGSSLPHLSPSNLTSGDSPPQTPIWTEEDQAIFDQILQYHQESGIPMDFGLPPDFGAEESQIRATGVADDER